MLYFANGIDPLQPEVPVIDPFVRIDAAKAVMPYIRPKLANLTVTGEGGEGPVEVSMRLTDDMMRDPQMRRMWEDIQIRMAEKQVAEAIDGAIEVVAQDVMEEDDEQDESLVTVDSGKTEEADRWRN